VIRYPTRGGEPLSATVPLKPSSAPGTGLPLTRAAPNVATPLALGWMPVPPFAEPCRLVAVSVNWSCASVACRNGIRPRSTTTLLPFECPSDTGW
jgi:hypothetical protein